MTAEFSVVIPTFGRPAFLADALESVRVQTFADFECIVVDDAGPEEPTLPDDSRFRLLRRDTNGGPPAARNTGIAVATGHFLAFLDDDDVWVPNRLANAVEAHGRAPVVVCWQSTLGSTDEAAGRVLEGDVRDTILDGMTPHVGATSIDRLVAPMFDERYEASDDVDWWLRVAQQSSVATVTEVGLLYRVHATPRTRTSQKNRLQNAEALMAENDDWFRRHPRVKAFRLKRMGLSALQIDDRKLARRYFTESLRLQPDARTAWHALRTLVP